MNLTPGTWVKLRKEEEYDGPWQTCGVVQQIDPDRLEAQIHFSDGSISWVPVVDLLLLK